MRLVGNRGLMKLSTNMTLILFYLVKSSIRVNGVSCLHILNDHYIWSLVQVRDALLRACLKHIQMLTS